MEEPEEAEFWSNNAVRRLGYREESENDGLNFSHNEDSSFESWDDAPNSIVSLYNQLDTRGEIGGVHTGRVLLKTVKNVDSGSLVVENYESNKMITGLSMYNPKIKHNGMVRRRFQQFSEN